MSTDPSGYCSRCGNLSYNAASMSLSAWEQHLRQYPVNNSIYDEPVSNSKRDFSNCKFAEDTKGYIQGGKEKFPTTGKPNTKSTLYGKNGQVIRERWYGSDGNPLKDRDWTDHGNAKQHPNVPHDHDWVVGPGGTLERLPDYPSPGLTIDDRPFGIALFAYGEAGNNFYGFPIPAPGPYYFPYPLPSPFFGGAPVIVY